MRRVALATLLVLHGHRLDGCTEDAALLGDDATGATLFVFLLLLVLLRIGLVHASQVFASSLHMALCVQCLGLDKALHVSVREIEIAAQGDLIGMHVVGAVIEAQTRKGCEALIGRGRHEGIHGREGGRHVHGHGSYVGGHVGAI